MTDRLHVTPRRHAEPTLPVFLFRPLSVPAGLEIIDLSSDDWSEIVPPAHVCAAVKGGA